jgi:hypothetical protein
MNTVDNVPGAVIAPISNSEEVTIIESKPAYISEKLRYTHDSGQFDVLPTGFDTQTCVYSFNGLL